MREAPMADISPELIRALSSVHAGTVLEVGCGDGEFTEVLVEQLGSYASIHAIDMIEDSVREAKAYFDKAHPQAPVSFRMADAAALPYPDESFDTVAISNSIHHMADPEPAVRDMLRVLKPGGSLVVNEMIADVDDPKEQIGRDLHHLKARVDRTHGIVHNPTWSRVALADFLGRLGLAECESVEYPRREITDADVDVEERLLNLDAYAEHAAGSTDYPEIRREVSRLKQRLRAVGFAAPPQLLFLCKKPVPNPARRSERIL